MLTRRAFILTSTAASITVGCGGELVAVGAVVLASIRLLRIAFDIGESIEALAIFKNRNQEEPRSYEVVWTLQRLVGTAENDDDPSNPIAIGQIVYAVSDRYELGPNEELEEFLPDMAASEPGVYFIAAYDRMELDGPIDDWESYRGKDVILVSDDLLVEV